MPSRRSPRPFTEAEQVFAEQLLSDGASYKEVARTLDRHASTILRKFPGQSSWTNTSGPQARKLNELLASVHL